MPTDTRRATGVKGEDEAARFLARCGYAILDKNVRTRAGEIDLVAKEGKTLVFVEVKTRKDAGGRSAAGGRANTRKQNRLGKLAHGYLKLKRMREMPCRFDVVAVIVNDEGGVKAIRHIPNAFSVAPGSVPRAVALEPKEPLRRALGRRRSDPKIRKREDRKPCTATSLRPPAGTHRAARGRHAAGVRGAGRGDGGPARARDRAAHPGAAGDLPRAGPPGGLHRVPLRRDGARSWWARSIPSTAAPPPAPPAASAVPSSSCLAGEANVATDPRARAPRRTSWWSASTTTTASTAPCWTARSARAGVSHLVVTGTMTDICVLATVVGGFNREYRHDRGRGRRGHALARDPARHARHHRGAPTRACVPAKDGGRRDRRTW